MSKPDPRCDEACMFICSGEAKQALAAANERIRELEETLALAAESEITFGANAIDQLKAERESLLAEQVLSDKLEKALKVAKAFCDGLTAEECPDTVALPISAALAEVGRLRSREVATSCHKENK